MIVVYEFNTKYTSYISFRDSSLLYQICSIGKLSSIKCIDEIGSSIITGGDEGISIFNLENPLKRTNIKIITEWLPLKNMIFLNNIKK